MHCQSGSSICEMRNDCSSSDRWLAHQLGCQALALSLNYDRPQIDIAEPRDFATRRNVGGHDVPKREE